MVNTMLIASVFVFLVTILTIAALSIQIEEERKDLKNLDKGSAAYASADSHMKYAAVVLVANILGMLISGYVVYRDLGLKDKAMGAYNAAKGANAYAFCPYDF